MLETLITGLALAAVSGITLIAYKHPSGYRKNFHPLIWVILTILVVNSIWTFGVQSAYTQLTPLIEVSKFPQMDEAMSRIMYRFRVVLIACPIASTYLILLAYLPKLLEKDLEQKKKESPDDPSFEKKDDKI